jgi:hypothetical protein
MPTRSSTFTRRGCGKRSSLVVRFFFLAGCHAHGLAWAWERHVALGHQPLLAGAMPTQGRGHGSSLPCPRPCVGMAPGVIGDMVIALPPSPLPSASPSTDRGTASAVDSGGPSGRKTSPVKHQRIVPRTEVLPAPFTPSIRVNLLVTSNVTTGVGSSTLPKR